MGGRGDLKVDYSYLLVGVLLFKGDPYRFFAVISVVIDSKENSSTPQQRYFNFSVKVIFQKLLHWQNVGA